MTGLYAYVSSDFFLIATTRIIKIMFCFFAGIRCDVSQMTSKKSGDCFALSKWYVLYLYQPGYFA